MRLAMVLLITYPILTSRRNYILLFKNEIKKQLTKKHFMTLEK